MKQKLEKQGYAQTRFTQGFCNQKWTPIALTLVVNNFGVKYVIRNHNKKLIEILKDHYEISEE